MASPTQWTWVWASSGSWWWTGRPGLLQSMGLQRVRHDWVTEVNWTGLLSFNSPKSPKQNRFLPLVYRWGNWGPECRPLGGHADRSEPLWPWAQVLFNHSKCFTYSRCSSTNSERPMSWTAFIPLAQLHSSLHGIFTCCPPCCWEVHTQSSPIFTPATACNISTKMYNAKDPGS